jgi:hypothetical protein
MSVPMTVLAPGRLSMMTCSPQTSVNRCPTRREVQVVLPPGE